MFSVISGDGGQRAWAACAYATSRLSSSANLVWLRVPTPGAIFWGARHVPRPLLLPGFGTGEGVSGTVSVAVSISFACVRGGVMGGVISSVTGDSSKPCALLGVMMGAPRRPVGAAVPMPV